MRFVPAALAAFVVLSVSAATAQAPRQQQREWRPDWAAALPYLPPAGTIGVTAFVLGRNPCEIQLYIANTTDATIRNIWGTMRVQPGAVPTRFQARFIDPNFSRGVPTATMDACPRNIERVEIREIGPCVRGQTHLRGCGVPVVPFLSRLTHPRRDALQVVVAPDFDR